MGAWGYLVVLSAFGGTRGTDMHCGGTTEHWVVLKVLWSNRGVLWVTFGYGWVLLGVEGYWVGEYEWVIGFLYPEVPNSTGQYPQYP